MKNTGFLVPLLIIIFIFFAIYFLASSLKNIADNKHPEIIDSKTEIIVK